VGNTNTTGGTLSSGTYVYVKGHSSIAEGLRITTASISNNGNITTSNTSAVSGGGMNNVKSIIDNFIYGGALPNNTDLNDVTTPGFYGLGGSNTYTNKPSSDFYAMLVLRPATGSTNIIQIGFGTSHMYFRINTGSATWYRITTTAV
jgi:hypothetical protein